jgi:TATA-box binding protein (TBP) (component of TFIID and TFIIIB)
MTGFSCNCKNLRELHMLLPHSKLYEGRPTMLKLKNHGVTILIFSNYTVRVMGTGDLHNHVFQKLLEKIPYSAQTKPFQLMSHSVTHKFDFKINLHKLTTNRFSVELEIFPAAVYKHTGQMHANIFQSGAVVITGVKILEQAQILINDIENCLKKLEHVVY